MSVHALTDCNRARVFIPFIFTFFFMALGLLSSCTASKEAGKEKIRIALSRGSGSPSYENYAKWLKEANPEVECVDLYKSENAIGDLMTCAGLVLTGGPDVEPFRYGKAGDSSRCEMDIDRDHDEFMLISQAMNERMPILGICRGEQILNVNFGGTLIVDIPTDTKSEVKHQCPDPNDCFHEVDIVPGTLLDSVCGRNRTGLVNSNHHQAIEDVGYLFKVSARSKDGLVEAIEWDEPARKPFLLAVQWHPERLDAKSPYSLPIARIFLENAAAYKTKVDAIMKALQRQTTEEQEGK